MPNLLSSPLHRRNISQIALNEFSPVIILVEEDARLMAPILPCCFVLASVSGYDVDLLYAVEELCGDFWIGIENCPLCKQANNCMACGRCFSPSPIPA